ncbi:MAG: OsmC family protein [Ignavibacteria bacterium]|nr:OsmC family protein [Ignavibacteria bacterium]
MEAHYYSIDVEWNQERKGMMCSPELKLSTGDTSSCIEVATPPEFPKGIPGIWSPEHLFTASVSSCLMTTFLAIAENFKLEFLRFSCKSKGKLDQVDGKFLMTEIILEPTVVIMHEKDRERAERVLQKSEAACLISNSIKSKVSMYPTILLSNENQIL